MDKELPRSSIRASRDGTWSKKRGLTSNRAKNDAKLFSFMSSAMRSH